MRARDSWRFALWSARSFLERPIGNVVIGSQAPIRSRRRHIVEAGVVSTGTLVHIIVAPRILGYHIALKIWAVPVGGLARLLDQIRQAASALRIIPHVHLKGVERGLECGNLRLRRGHPTALGHAGEFRKNDGCQRAENDQHEQQLDQCERVLVPANCDGLADVFFHKSYGVYLMYCCRVKIGSNMPMKIKPMNPAMMNSINGSVKATAVFSCRSKSPSVTLAMRTNSPSSRPLSSATEIISNIEPGNSPRHAARL